MSRGAGIVLLVALAALGGVVGIAALGNLFDDYKDDSTSTYLLFGLPFLFISIASLARLLSLPCSHWRRALMAAVWASCAAALGTAVAGLFVVDESFWQVIAVIAAISIALIAPWHGGGTSAPPATGSRAGPR